VTTPVLITEYLKRDVELNEALTETLNFGRRTKRAGLAREAEQSGGKANRVPPIAIEGALRNPD